MLLETPCCPRFGITSILVCLLLVPLWWILARSLSGLCMASSRFGRSGYLVYRISLTMGNNRTVSLLWSLAWLAQPVVGQMNLAYSYGWHR